MMIWEIEGGSNIMVIGPPLIGKVSLVKEIVWGEIEKGSGVIYVTTKETGEEILREFENVDIRVIDCVSKLAISDVSDTENIKRVASPLDLTGISVGVNKFLEEYFKQGKTAVIVFDSLSNLLMYSNLQTVFRFLHVLTTRIRAAKAKAIYIVEEGMHDEKTVATLKQIFNGVIELKEENDKRFFRFKSSKVRSDWELVDSMVS